MTTYLISNITKQAVELLDEDEIVRNDVILIQEPDGIKEQVVSDVKYFIHTIGKVANVKKYIYYG